MKKHNKAVMNFSCSLIWLFKHLFCVATAILCLPSNCIAQSNLVEDGTFEKYRFCPRDQTYETQIALKYWSLPTAGTTDYYSTCCNNNVVGVPKNIMGHIYPINGTGYIGMILYTKRKKNYREYIQTPLIRKLDKDTLYYFRAYIALAGKTQYSIDSFGVSLYHKVLDKQNFKRVLDISPDLQFDISHITETDAWVMISAYFVAQGNETTIVLGNFLKDWEMRLVKKPEQVIKPHAYYYLDDVLLCKASDLQNHIDSAYTNQVTNNAKTPPIHPKGNTKTRKDTLITIHLNFAYNSFALTQQDSIVIQGLVQRIGSNQADSLLIIGHTDSIGTKLYNMNLSLERAKAVQKALLKEIPGLKTIAYGMGSDRPIADNNTAEGRKENRRVEIFMKIPVRNSE